jgi:hypothetical protein
MMPSPHHTHQVHAGDLPGDASPLLATLHPQLHASNFLGKEAEVRLFYNQDGHDVLAVVGLGSLDAAAGDVEAAADAADPRPAHVRERAAAATAVTSIRALAHTSASLAIEFRNFTQPQATAEGAELGTFSFEQLKHKKAPGPAGYRLFPQSPQAMWEEGLVFGKGRIGDGRVCVCACACAREGNPRCARPC